MIAREYNKRITVIEVLTSQNEFGGTVTDEVELSKSWCKIVTKSAGYKATDFGIDTFERPVIFNFRYRNDFEYQGRTLYIVYKGSRYVIKGIRQVNEAGIEVEVIAQLLEPNEYGTGT